MFITKGIIVDAGASQVQNPNYDDKLKVRIPELHGYGNLSKNFQESQYTLDENLPWCKVVVNDINPETNYPVVQYKAQTYAPADIVYVRIDSESSNTNYLVLGIYEKYNENVDDTSVTIYNNIDVSEILANKVDFPTSLTNPNPSNSNDDIDDSEDNDITDAPEDGEGADNDKKKYKYFFGNPFAKKSQYYISSGFPKRNNGRDPHAGLDLAGSVGTPLYAVADGTAYRVVKSGYGSGFGHHVQIDHGVCPIDGKHYYTVYGHMDKVSINSGAKVKGTQLVADTPFNEAYKKTEVGTYVLLKKKPKDWDCGGWRKYYKVTGSSARPVYKPIGDKKQLGTQIGTRGNTGHSTGPHLHFGVTTAKARFSKSDFDVLRDPRNFISF